MIVVGTLYQLSMLNGKPLKEHKTVIREKMKVHDNWANDINNNWQDSGRLFEVDKKATEDYYLKSEIDNETRKKIAELKDEKHIEVLTKAIGTAVEVTAKKGRPTKQKEE